MLYLFYFSNQELQNIAMELNLIPDQDKRLTENWYRYDSEFLLSLLVCIFYNFFFKCYTYIKLKSF